MKVLSLLSIVLGLSVQGVAASCIEDTFSGKVEFRNISGSCGYQGESNDVIKAMISLAKADATQNANWRFLFYNGARQETEFEVTCTHRGLVAEVIAEATFSGVRCF